jgi:polysaccharide chain length determinant protein (PEP-CTERM system associated)
MPHSSETRLHYHANVIQRRWRIGLTTTATVLAVLAPVAMGLPNLYRSSASLIVDQAPDPLGTQSEAQMIELSGRLQTLRQEALSRQRVVAMAEEMDLYRPQRQAGALDEIVGLMQRDVKVEPTSASRGDGRTTTISFRISYTGSDPQKVAAVANRLARFYVERNDDMMSRVASRTAESLKQELDSLQARVETQQKKLIRYTEQNAGALPANMAAVMTKYGQLTANQQANAAEIIRRTDAREAALLQIATLSNPTTAASSTDPAIRLAAAEQELADLRMKYTEADYKVRNKKNEVDGLRARLAERGGKAAPGTGENSLLVTLRRQVEDGTARIRELEKENAAIQAELKKYDTLIENAPVRSAEFESINREVTQTRALYDALYVRYQNALVGERAQGRGSAEFQVLDAAVPPDSPSAPDRNLLLILSLIAAVSLGLTAMIFFDRMDRSFRSVDELRAFTHVPVLATIPRIVLRRAKLKRAFVAVLAAAAFSVALWGVGVGAFRFAEGAELLTRMLLR